ncbi:MAG: fibronectin type III domain-containing protein [Candidatus Hydrogenedentes bacterium]|nr:fibronectin type III domain-containing protein [Candidatus Hydrogenedentota bacterium]
MRLGWTDGICARTLIILCVSAVFTFAEPLLDHAWQLHDSDWSVIQRTVERAPAFGVTEIQLSHGVVDAIDEIVEDSETRERVRRASELADQFGIATHVWAHELNIGKNKLDQCLDPEGAGKEMWDQRRAAYRGALRLCPSVDGVVLMFGSCPTEVWHIRGTACEFNARTPNEDRVAMTIQIIREVVCDEFGKKLVVRDFCHSPQQLEWYRLGMLKHRGLRAMIKEVPQDWQPYYPLNRVIGNVGANDSFIELDLGAEYWGRNHILFCMPDYLARRFSEFAARGITGVVARVECGSDHALDTPNEVNLYALSRLIRDPNVSPETMWRDWVAQRYALAPDSEAGQHLIAALRRSFDVGRKMYYVLDQWALEKSSDIPAEPQAACLIGKNSAQWDPDFTAWYEELRNPSAATLRRIWQEKEEAIELAQTSLDDLAVARVGLRSEDYQDLRARMVHQHRCAQVWKYVTDVVFRKQLFERERRTEDRRLIEFDLRALEALARETAPTAEPANPDRIRAFTAAAAQLLPKIDRAVAPDFNVLSRIRAEEVSGDAATICWTSERKGDGWVEWGTKLPRFEQHSETEAPWAEQHRIVITGLQPGTRYVFRVGTGDVISSDYSFTTCSAPVQTLR